MNCLILLELLLLIHGFLLQVGLDLDILTLNMLKERLFLCYTGLYPHNHLYIRLKTNLSRKINGKAYQETDSLYQDNNHQYEIFQLNHSIVCMQVE